MAQVVFERAVQHEIEDALIPHFEMIEEFSLGDVLLRHHKPHWYSSGKSLDYTGEPLTGILAQEDVNELRVHTKTKKLHADVVTLQSKLSVNIEHDAKLKEALISVGADLSGKGKKFANFQADFGNIDHIYGDLYQAFSTKPYRVNTKHPLVETAIKKGRIMYFISSIFLSEKVRISVVIQKGQSAKGNPTTSKQEDPEDASSMRVYEQQVIEVIKRDTPTVIGFHVMKAKIELDHSIVPIDKNDFEHNEKIYTPYGDSYVMAADKMKVSVTPEPDTKDKEVKDDEGSQAGAIGGPN